jgi:hypothetical protein
MGKGSAVGPTELPGAAKLLFAEAGLTPPKRDGGLIVKSDASGSIGDVDGRRKRFDDLAKAGIPLREGDLRRIDAGRLCGWVGWAVRGRSPMG